MGTRAQVTGEHLQGGSIAGQGVRVGQQQLEPVITAPGAGGLNITVLVRSRCRGTIARSSSMREWSMVSMVRSVSGWSDGGLSIVFTAFRVSHIAQTILINNKVL